jgi:hypothetical protein
VNTMAYYVPKAKAQSLSPQQLFDPLTGHRGRYVGDHESFRLYLDGHDPLVLEYNERNSVPIGYASTGTKVVGVSTSNPQLNLTLMDGENQNLTAGQKLLLHWHHRFGHLNMPAAQRILRAVPFLTEKFKAASKCDTSGCDVPLVSLQKDIVELVKLQLLCQMKSKLVLSQSRSSEARGASVS